jgi:serine protease inhibitor
MKWATSIELAPQSTVVPSARLQQLSEDYCGHGIVRNQELKPNQSLFVTTAVFDGRWLNKFDRRSTSQGEFFATAHPSRVEFMHQKFDSSKVYFYEDQSASVVGLPYKNYQQIAYIVLPNKGTTLQQFIAAMLPDRLLRLMHSGTSSKGTLALPKLYIESSDKLNQILGSMGISHLFDPKRNSLPKLADNDRSRAIWIKQKIKLSLDEEGTKVSVLIAQLNETSAARQEPPPFNVIVDRPFLLAIEDVPTQEWLFLGAIFDPNGSSPVSADNDLERLAH